MSLTFRYAQVAGHLFEEGKAGSLVDDRGHFYKPIQPGPRGDRERSFYQSIAAARAADKAAWYNGGWTVGAVEALQAIASGKPIAEVLICRSSSSADMVASSADGALPPGADGDYIELENPDHSPSDPHPQPRLTSKTPMSSSPMAPATGLPTARRECSFGQGRRPCAATASAASADRGTKNAATRGYGYQRGNDFPTFRLDASFREGGAAPPQRDPVEVLQRDELGLIDEEVVEELLRWSETDSESDKEGDEGDNEEDHVLGGIDRDRDGRLHSHRGIRITERGGHGQGCFGAQGRTVVGDIVDDHTMMEGEDTSTMFLTESIRPSSPAMEMVGRVMVGASSDGEGAASEREESILSGSPDSEDGFEQTGSAVMDEVRDAHHRARVSSLDAKGAASMGALRGHSTHSTSTAMMDTAAAKTHATRVTAAQDETDDQAAALLLGRPSHECMWAGTARRRSSSRLSRRGQGMGSTHSIDSIEEALKQHVQSLSLRPTPSGNNVAAGAEKAECRFDDIIGVNTNDTNISTTTTTASDSASYGEASPASTMGSSPPYLSGGMMPYASGPNAAQQHVERAQQTRATLAMLPFSVRNAPLLRVIPKFYGVREADGRVLLELEDLARCYRHPAIMDVKVGHRTWYPGADPAYKERCAAKDASTTQAALGFKICGMQVYRHGRGGYWRASKRWCKTLPEPLVDKALLSFAHNEHGLRPSDVYGGPTGAVAQLRSLLSWFHVQQEFHFYSASVLLLYEGDATDAAEANVRVRLVDFAHTFPTWQPGREGHKNARPEKSPHPLSVGGVPLPLASLDANFAEGLSALLMRLGGLSRMDVADTLLL